MWKWLQTICLKDLAIPKMPSFVRSRDLILTEEKPQNLTLRPFEYRKSQYVVRKILVKFFMYNCDKTDEL